MSSTNEHQLVTQHDLTTKPPLGGSWSAARAPPHPSRWASFS